MHIGAVAGARKLSGRRHDHRRRASRPGRRRSIPAMASCRENADFAQAVIDAGLIWVGPHPDSIRAMGLKDAAKELMIAAGVPVTPGYLGEDQSADRLQARGRRDRLSGADQGGRGRRRQGHAPRRRCRGDFADALGSCQREAASSFGDDRVLIEKYILSPAPHRGAGVRRHPRQRRPSVRTRLLAAAPPPEGDRGSARARHGRRHPRGGLRRRGQGGAGGRLCRRRHDRVHRRRQRRPVAPTASGSWK